MIENPISEKEKKIISLIGNLLQSNCALYNHRKLLIIYINYIFASIYNCRMHCEVNLLNKQPGTKVKLII